MYVINEATKIINIWADSEINRQRLASGKYGVVEYIGEVEQGYNGILYAKGYAPKKSYELSAEEKRVERNKLLDATDKYMMPDYPLSKEEKAKYKKYRKYLRDITKDKAFPNIEIKTFENFE